MRTNWSKGLQSLFIQSMNRDELRTFAINNPEFAIQVYEERGTEFNLEQIVRIAQNNPELSLKVYEAHKNELSARDKANIAVVVAKAGNLELVKEIWEDCKVRSSDSEKLMLAEAFAKAGDLGLSLKVYKGCKGGLLDFQKSTFANKIAKAGDLGLSMEVYQGCKNKLTDSQKSSFVVAVAKAGNLELVKEIWEDCKGKLCPTEKVKIAVAVAKADPEFVKEIWEDCKGLHPLFKVSFAEAFAKAGDLGFAKEIYQECKVVALIHCRNSTFKVLVAFAKAGDLEFAKEIYQELEGKLNYWQKSTFAAVVAKAGDLELVKEIYQDNKTKLNTNDKARLAKADPELGLQILLENVNTLSTLDALQIYKSIDVSEMDLWKVADYLKEIIIRTNNNDILSFLDYSHLTSKEEVLEYLSQECGEKFEYLIKNNEHFLNALFSSDNLCHYMQQVQAALPNANYTFDTTLAFKGYMCLCDSPDNAVKEKAMQNLEALKELIQNFPRVLEFNEERLTKSFGECEEDLNDLMNWNQLVEGVAEDLIQGDLIGEDAQDAD